MEKGGGSPSSGSHEEHDWATDGELQEWTGHMAGHLLAGTEGPGVIGGRSFWLSRKRGRV